MDRSDKRSTRTNAIADWRMFDPAATSEPLYSAATVAELRAKADAAERRVAAALELAQKWQDKAADSWGEDKDDAARQQCCDELRATLTGADPT